MITEIPDEHWENRDVRQGMKKRFRKVHVPYMAGFAVTSNMKIEGFESIMVTIRKKDHDLMKEFCEVMAETVKELYDKHFMSQILLKMSREDEEDYNSGAKFHLSSKQIYPDSN